MKLAPLIAAKLTSHDLRHLHQIRRSTTLCLVISVVASLQTGCGTKRSGDAPLDSNAVESIALSSADVQTVPKLMESLEPAEIGIDFEHQWKPRNRYEAMLLKTGFTGGGVCVGDYDNNGRADVVLTRPHGGLQLYRNVGDFQFENATNAASVSCNEQWTTGVALVDLNRDQLLDLVVCTYDTANLVFINQGDGTFRELAKELGLDFRGASIKIAWADYDNDGDLDGYLVTNRLEPKVKASVKYLGGPGQYRVAPEFVEQVGVLNLPGQEQKFYKAGQADHLFKNLLVETGKLQFQDVTREAKLDGYWHGLDVTWWDANGDGWPDIYVANDFTDPDQFFQNNGDGTFSDVTLRALPSTPWFTMGAAFADLNRDGRLDLLATDMAGTTHYRQKMAMGSMDSLAWFLDSMEPRQHMRNALFLNTGTDRFMEVAQASGLANSDWTWSVKLADVDNDGFEDAYMTNGFTRDYLDSDFNLRLKESGNKDPLAWYNAPVLRESNLAFQNKSSERDQVKFQNVSDLWGLAERGISFGAAFGDLDNDGDLDLIVNNFGSPPSIYRNRSTTRSNRIKIALRGTASNSQGYGAVVTLGDQIRWFNPHSGYMSANEPLIFFGLGDQTSIPKITVRWPSGTVQHLNDVSANQLLTITEMPSEAPPNTTVERTSDFKPAHELFAGYKHVERPFDDYAEQPLLPNKLSQLGPGMAWGDVNGDGLDDVYLGGAAGQTGQLLIAKHDGRFTASQSTGFAADAKSEDMGCLLLDVDGDADLDLYVVSGGVESPANDESLRDRLYLNEGVKPDGSVSWRKSENRLPDLRESGGPVAAADFDRDGDLDLVVGGRVLPGQYPLSSPSRLLVNNAGRFEDGTADHGPDLPNAGMVTSALWCDVDSDGWCDLFLTCEYGPIRLYMNRDGILSEPTSDAGFANHPGWWNGIACSDVDADGDLDVVATNFGNNTKYHPSQENPQLIFFADFDESGKTRIVEAKSTGAELLPVRGLSCSSNAMPVLRERFQTYHSFASADLEEIYSQSQLEHALQRQATTLKSCLFKNDGKGHFEIQALPALAQVAPSFGVQFVVGGDHSPRIFVAQNFYHAQRETGRMNGGVGAILVPKAIGAGPSDYVARWPDDSGIVVPEDAKSACAVDVNRDGWQDLVIGVNNDSPKCFIQNPPSNIQPFTVRLRGLPGNNHSIGTHVIAHGDDGSTRLHVVTAGEGYLTQRPPIVYMSSRPSRLTVRWPDGQQSDHIVESATAHSVELAHPMTVN